jgi:hypothetical protein
MSNLKSFLGRQILAKLSCEPLDLSLQNITEMIVGHP